MDIQMFDKYVIDPFERVELRMNPMMYEKMKRRMSGGSSAMHSKIHSNMNRNVHSMSAFPTQTPLAMAYIPFQQWEEPYDEANALSRGTMFPALDLPFLAYGGNCNE